MIAPAMLTTQSNTPQALAQAPVPQADHDRKRAMREAWKAYRGDFQKPLKVKAGDADDNVICNRCSPIVDKGVSFLFGPILKIEATDEQTGDDDTSDTSDDTLSPIQDFLDGFWGDDDDKMTTLSNQAINGGVCGENFVKLIPAKWGMKYPRLVILNPELIRKVTLPDDCSIVLAYIIEYPKSGDVQKRQIVARVDPNDTVESVGPDDLNDTWTITDYVQRGQDRVWTQVKQEDWPYPFPPIFSNQNLPNPNEPWGVPDLTPDIVGMNKALNFATSNMQRVVKYHGHPRTYAVNVQASQIQIAADEVLCLPAPDSKIEALAAMENFTGLLSVVANLRGNMDEQSRVPAVALGREETLPKGNISGVALQLLFQPLIEKTVEKRRLYGKLIREVSRAALVVGGLIPVEDFEDYNIELMWQDLLPIDDLLAAQTAMLLQQMGIVSDSTLAQKLGFSPADEQQKLQQEAAEKMQAYSKGQGLPVTPPDQQLQPGAFPNANQQPAGGQQL